VKTRPGHTLAIAAATLLLAALSLCGCSRLAESSLKLPANPVLSGGLGWALVKEAYVRLKEKPSDAAKDVSYVRRGEIYEISGRDFGAADPQSGQSPRLWYGVELKDSGGWLRESDIEVYASKDQAELAATRLATSEHK
jgi:hypothetical protein